MIHENNGLTIGEQKNAIQNFYNPLLTEFRDMWWGWDGEGGVGGEGTEEAGGVGRGGWRTDGQGGDQK